MGKDAGLASGLNTVPESTKEKMTVRLGITVSFQHSVFSSGVSQTSLALAELFSFLGDSCTFIHVGEESWWTDVPSLQTKWPCVKYSDVKEGQFDRILEVTLCPSLREFAPCIWIVRKTPLFFDMEASVVPYPMAKRDLTGIAETWVQEELTTSDDIQYIELITRKPVRRVPFVWSAIAIEAFRQENKPPIWQQTHVPGEYTVHVCETNTTSSSSCLIPLCIYKEGLSSHKLTVHNAEALKDSEYFRKNLWENLMGTPMDMFVGRQRIVEIPRQKNTLIVAHSRFITLRPYHLDALWCGIPLVHNSTLLQGLHADVDRGYYPSNDIVLGVEAAKSLMNKWISQSDLFQVRKNILHRFGILNESLRQRWKAACHADIQRPVPVAKKRLRIGFSDMWSNFNPSYNFFTLLLESTFPNYTIEVSDKPDVLIFGPFGSDWEKYSIPKIHYTGENSPPIRREDVVLNLGYERREDAYIRLPLWVLEIDWFGADPAKIRNPIPIPLEAVVAHPRKKFCAFVVSNPCQPIRNRIFHALSIYKDVDSAGRLYNTLGSSLFAGEGGGGGERAKVEFLRQYKFCIAYENAASPGYITEKLFHAKAAGCVPIYWGAPDVELEFNMDGVIDARGKTEEEVVALVRQVDENPDLWLKMANTPLLRGDQKPLLSKVAHAIMAAASAPAPAPASARASASKEQTVKLDAGVALASLANTVFVTGCNIKFIDTLLRYWLPPIEAQRASSTNVQIHVYLMHDVTDEDKARVIKAFPFTRLFDLPTDQFFPDCWNPQHFLWKLWILKETGKIVTPGYPVVYLDTGVFFCRWPQGWLAKVKKEGLCFLEDPNHDNRNMCSKEFCKKMNVTQEELNDLQLWAGGISFLAGHPSTRIFEEAWTWGLDPEVITGNKWMGVDAKNKPIGHRHDQSILSILSKRHGSPRYPLYDVYCGISLRHTFLKGLSLYVHRGFFVVNDPIAMGVDTTWIINLDRRADRMVRGNFSEKALRFPAIDGRSLNLTPDLVRMFSASKINWRKGVMACALSHISLWMKLCADKPDIQTYLILEDDAVLQPDSVPLLNAIHEKGLPADWDILYLGGILPPNKEGFETVVEPVNEYIGRIKENTLFSTTPSRYFHFCAYSYIIRRKAAEALCARLRKTGCWAPADHLLCNSHEELNIYCTIPLVAGCYQDTDPRYAVSNFNVFGKEEYDSDLRNEDVFTQEEVLASTLPGEFSLERALGDAHVKAVNAVKAVKAVNAPVTRYPLIFHDMSGLFEQSWLEELLGQKLSDIQTEIPIFLYQRPYCEQIKKTLAGWPEFTLLHLSDEDGQDPIDIYDWPSCKGVIRNYMKKGLSNKVVTIPLGYHWAGPLENKGRDLFWSFIGADHKMRRDSLQQFKAIQPNKCVFQKEWNSPEKCGKEEVVDTLQRSLCVPCPRGVNYETFRIYEALEAGAVPVLVEEPGCAELLAYLKRWIPLATSPDWNTAARVVYGLTTRPELYKEYRKSLLVGWASLKQWSAKEVKRVLLRSKE